MHEQSFIELTVEIISAGGWVMIPLFILGFMAFYIGSRLFLYFKRANVKKTSIAQCEEWIKNPDAAQGQVGEIIRYSQEGVNSLGDIQNRFAEIRTAEVPRLSQNLVLLTIIVNVAPLMGLLGTVLGMLTTFQGISLGGADQTTNVVADGIHEALITTQMGLCLAIPGYFVCYFIRQKVIDFEGFLVRLESITLQELREKFSAK